MEDPAPQIPPPPPAPAPSALPPAAPATASAGAALTRNENSVTWSVLAHIGGLLTSFIAPLVIYLIRKGELDDGFATANAREALNFQITVLLAMVATSIVAMVPLIGLLAVLVFPAIGIANLVCCIIAAVKASNGEVWSYPLTLRLIR